MVYREKIHFLFCSPIGILPNERLKEHSNTECPCKHFEWYALKSAIDGDDDGRSAVMVVGKAHYTILR